MGTTPRRAPAVEGELIPAAGYMRVSTEKQAEQYSPELQREAIRAFARQQGYLLVLQEQDVQRGRVVERSGYQRILDGVRAGTVHAVIVYMFDRWGRDGAEWAIRARELERLRVPFLSVQEGREEGGVMRFVRAGMAEEYSRQLAKRVRPARAAAVREGRHIVEAPFGYLKRYPERVGAGKRIESVLDVDPAAAPFVDRIFRMWALEGHSHAAIARYLNEAPGAPRAPKGGAWTRYSLRYILANPVYTGRLRWNARQEGYYDAAAPEDLFVCEGTHQALISDDLWEAAQARSAGKVSPVRAYREPRQLAMGEGILKCAYCDARMALDLQRNNPGREPRYRCMGRHAGSTTCPGSTYTAAVAHAALAAQVARLRYAPWDEEYVRNVTDAGEDAAELVAVQATLSEAQESMRRHVRRFAAMVDDPTREEIQAHREVGRELSERIRTLEVRAAELQEAPRSIEELRILHGQLASVDTAAEVRCLQETGDSDRLAVLVHHYIATAVLDARVPERWTRWAHARVEWTPDTQMQMDLSLITLAPEVPAPDVDHDRLERHRDAVRQHRARVRAGQVAPRPGSRTE